LAQNNIRFVEQKDGFEENILSFADPDGLSLALIETEKGKTSQPWITSEIAAQYATQGFYGITLTLNETEPSVEVLKELLGYTFQASKVHLRDFRISSKPMLHISIFLNYLMNPKHLLPLVLSIMWHSERQPMSLLSYKERRF
jgi:hypothetical protein